MTFIAIFVKVTLLLLTECVQPCMSVSVLILCTPERGHSVFDTHLFSSCVSELVFAECSLAGCATENNALYK